MNDKKIFQFVLLPDQFHKFSDGNSTVVVVDLLRATTVISTGFMEGIEAIIPVQSLELAMSYQGREGYIVAAERNAKLIEGFSYGNSPFHYINTNVTGKILVLTTTNGTKAIHNAKIIKLLPPHI